MHGGLTPRGKESPQYVHGRRSKYMTSLGDYERTHADPEALMDLTHQLAGLELMVGRAAKRAEERDTPHFRRDLVALFEEMESAMIGGDVNEIVAAKNQLRGLIARGAAADSADEFLMRSLERMAYRAEQAWKIRITRMGTITPQAMRQALEAMGRLVLEEAGSELGRKILARFDSEIMEGRSAVDLP